MAIARRLQWYLDAKGVRYDVLPHPHSSSSMETAQRVQVSADWLAKPVLLEDERGYVMAIVPASHRIDLGRLNQQLHRELELANEREIAELFHDCDRGAMPALGSPYRVPTVYDDALTAAAEVYFEAGDHEDVVHLHGGDFLRLLEGSLHGRFSQRV
ncbi:MAG: aminoacyl-tRNA deacylase [Myxococcota bacterium]